MGTGEARMLAGSLSSSSGGSIAMSNSVDRESGSWGDPMWLAITVGLSTARSSSSTMSVQTSGNNAGDASRSADNWPFPAPPHAPLPLLPASDTTGTTSADVAAAPRVSASVTTTEGVATVAHVADSRESGSTGPPSTGTALTPLTTGCCSSGSVGGGTFTDGPDSGAALDGTEPGPGATSAQVVTRGECAIVVIVVALGTAVAITDFTIVFAREGLGVDNGRPEGDGTALAVLLVVTARMGLLAVGGILETTSRIGGDTDLLAADDRDETPWLAGEEINSARDDLRLSPEGGSARRTALGTPLELAGRASTGWQLVGDDEGAVVAAARLPLKMSVSRCCGSLLAPLLLLLPVVLHMEGEIIWPPGTCNMLEGTSTKLPAGWGCTGCVLTIASATSDVVVVAGRVESHVVGEEQEGEGMEEEDMELAATAAPAMSEEGAAASDRVAID